MTERGQRLVGRLLELNKRHAEVFTSSDAGAERRRYLSQHPTEIGVFKCMDGRIHLPLMTRMPLGVLAAWRNIGGQFELGWPFFGHDVRAWLDRVKHRVHPCLLLVTYHFSRGDTHRGCAGFGYDTQAAIAHTRKLKEHIEHVFGSRKHGVEVVHVGIETDSEALILHGDNGEEFECGTSRPDHHSGSIMTVLQQFYPSMPAQVKLDFAPLVLGNIQHVHDIRASNRPAVDIEHREWVLGVGRGFDWLHEINAALLIGPYDPNLDEPIQKAAGLIEGNMEAGRINAEDGFVLLTSATHWGDGGSGQGLAEAEARFLYGFAMKAIGRTHPHLLDCITPLVATVHFETRELLVIEV